MKKTYFLIICVILGVVLTACDLFNDDKKEYTVTVVSEIGGTASGGGTVNKNSAVTVIANANANYFFLGWYESDVIMSKSASYSFVVTKDTKLTAKFSGLLEAPALKHDISINRNRKLDSKDKEKVTGLFWITVGHNVTEKYLIEDYKNGVLYEFGHWQDSGSISVTFSEITRENIEKVVTETFSIGLPVGKLVRLGYDYKQTVTSIVNTTRSLSSTSTFDLSNYKSGYDYRIVLIGEYQIYEVTTYYESTNGKIKDKEINYELVVRNPSNIRIRVVSRKK